MAKNRNPETAYLKAKEHYEKTGDVHYIVLAIGAYPKNPPQWAIDACREYFTKSRQQDFFNLKKRPGPKLADKDYERLELMSELIAAGHTVNAAANKVTEDDRNKEANMKKLIRQYQKEAQLNEQGELEAPRRLERAIVKRVKAGRWGKKE